MMNIATIRTRLVALGAAVAVLGGSGVAIGQAVSGTTDEVRTPPDSLGMPALAKSDYPALQRSNVATPDQAYGQQLKRAMKDANPDIDPGTLRLARKRDGVEIFAAAGTSSLCAVNRHVTGSRRITSMSCGNATDVQGRPVFKLSSAYDVGNTFFVAGLAPVNVKEATLLFVDGTSTELTIDNGTVAYHGVRRPSSVEWTGLDGSSGTVDVSLPDNGAPGSE